MLLQKRSMQGSEDFLRELFRLVRSEVFLGRFFFFFFFLRQGHRSRDAKRSISSNFAGTFHFGFILPWTTFLRILEMNSLKVNAVQ